MSLHTPTCQLLSAYAGIIIQSSDSYQQMRVIYKRSSPGTDAEAIQVSWSMGGPLYGYQQMQKL